MENKTIITFTTEMFMQAEPIINWTTYTSNLPQTVYNVNISREEVCKTGGLIIYMILLFSFFTCPLDPFWRVFVRFWPSRALPRGDQVSRILHAKYRRITTLCGAILLGLALYLNNCVSVVPFALMTLCVTLSHIATSLVIRDRVVMLASYNEPGCYTLKDLFFQTKVPEVESNTTHGKYTAVRKLANRIMDSIISYSRSGRYDWQTKLPGVRGNWVHYWDKDLCLPEKCDMMLDRDIITMVDVDYYVDMPRHLADNIRPHIIFTTSPHKAADHGVYSYTYKDNLLNVSISGGASYKHKLWNYGLDNFTVRGSYNGLAYNAHYLVERRNIGSDHQLVLLVPDAIVFAPRRLNTGNVLSRYSPCRAGTTHVITQSVDGNLQHSIALEGSYSSVELTDGEYTACASLATTCKTFTSGLVATYCKSLNSMEKQIAARYFELVNDLTIVPVVYCVPGLVRYQCGDEFDPHAKNGMQPFCNSIVGDAWSMSPDTCLANDQACVKGRIEKVRNNLPLTDRQASRILEFVKILNIPKLQPCDLLQVRERQTRPAQRQITWQGENGVDKGSLSTFMKKETYPKCSDPRNITPLQPKVKVTYSRYTYPLGDWMKTQPWYGFGATEKVANRVTEICSSSQNVVCTDYSRYDGTIGPAIRHMERSVMIAAFGPDKDLLWSLDRQVNQKAFTTFGVKYDTGNGRQSGSPETSLCNTLANFFICWNYVTDQLGRPAQVHEVKALCAGDDGLMGDVEPALLDAVASSFGLKLKCESIKRGELGVSFLARNFTRAVWHGDNTSMCDLIRSLGRFHTTLKCPDGPLVKFSEKLAAYKLTDSNTPIFRELIHTAERVGMELTWTGTKEYTSYRLLSSGGWPNKPSPDFEEMARLNLQDHFDWLAFYEACERCKKPDDMLHIPCCLVQPHIEEPVINVIRNGESVVVDGAPVNKGKAPVSGVSVTTPRPAAQVSSVARTHAASPQSQTKSVPSTSAKVLKPSGSSAHIKPVQPPRLPKPLTTTAHGKPLVYRVVKKP